MPTDTTPWHNVQEQFDRFTLSLSPELCTNTIFRWNRQTRHVVDAILKIIEDFDDYLPLTVRQVYYQLVARLILRNDKTQYRKTSRLLVQMRERELVPWSAIEDRMRYTVEKRGTTDLSRYLRDALTWFEPTSYGRCYVQDQSVYCEVSTEKDALASILEKEIWPYCTRLNVVRGQYSATFVEEISKRFDAAIMRGQRPTLLHFGDLDPSGVAIPKAVKKNFEKRHGISVDVQQPALTPDQVREYNLPTAIDAIKPKDPNLHAWLDLYGPAQPAVELDALSPKVLKEILRRELNQIYDISGMGDEKRAEVKERQTLARIQTDVMRLIRTNYPEVQI